MRAAYVGLSTPLFYDYRNPARKTPSDLQSSPNPILDSPFGLFLLFDEIWFLCESLCPQNMRSLPYVRFLDQTRALPQLSDIILSDLGKSVQGDRALLERYRKFFQNVSVPYRKTVNRVGIKWRAAPDNHTHQLKIADLSISANSWDLTKLLFDMEVVKRLDRPEVELITNSFSQTWLEEPNTLLQRIKLAELLVIENIPNYLTPVGPYHSSVEKARGSKFLKDFRRWIQEQSFDAGEKELLEMKLAVEAEIQRSRDEVFLKYLDPVSQYLSVGKIMLGKGLDAVTPGASAVMGVAEGLSSFFERKQRRWQGFIVSFKKSAFQ